MRELLLECMINFSVPSGIHDKIQISRCNVEVRGEWKERNIRMCNCSKCIWCIRMISSNQTKNISSSMQSKGSWPKNKSKSIEVIISSNISSDFNMLSSNLMWINKSIRLPLLPPIFYLVFIVEQNSTKPLKKNKKN